MYFYIFNKFVSVYLLTVTLLYNKIKFYAILFLEVLKRMSMTLTPSMISLTLMVSMISIT